ncbi:MAG: hypothetical protein H6855_03145 [Rhodospirillales bacterium]|nr:hypothetical protein [Rhodospirillales bacterium]MCB9973524.1 hypothetical protein [Rhodospirillales bacterium]MCB9980680.1 hypothetical protein [Rhodospirillales bacterium]
MSQNTTSSTLFTAAISQRAELIALSQLIAEHLGEETLRQQEPVIITLYGEPNSGKSLIPTAMRAQKLGTATIEPGIMTEHLWAARQAPSGAYLTIQFKNCNFNNNPESPSAALLTFNPLTKRNLKSEGDLIFVQNPAPAYRHLSDMSLTVTPTEDTPPYRTWERVIEIEILDPRLLEDKTFLTFWNNLSMEQVRDAAQQVPEDYLKTPGQTYPAIDYAGVTSSESHQDRAPGHPSP